MGIPPRSLPTAETTASGEPCRQPGWDENGTTQGIMIPWPLKERILESSSCQAEDFFLYHSIVGSLGWNLLVQQSVVPGKFRSKSVHFEMFQASSHLWPGDPKRGVGSPHLQLELAIPLLVFLRDSIWTVIILLKKQIEYDVRNPTTGHQPHWFWRLYTNNEFLPSNTGGSYKMFQPILGNHQEPAVWGARASKWHMPWLSLWAPAATWDRANDVLPITKAPEKASWLHRGMRWSSRSVDLAKWSHAVTYHKYP